MRRFQEIARAVVLTGTTCTLMTLGPGCDSAKPPPAAEAKAIPSRTGQPAVAKPNINPHESMNAKAVQEPVMLSQEGTFDVVVGGETMHLTSLPPGQNMARATEGRKPLFSVAASTTTGYPHILVEMTGWRPDSLRYPIELHSTKQQSFRFVYRAGEHGALSTKLEATLRGENKVTLESYEGGVLKGSFSGTVAPRVETQGLSVQVSGTFTSTLRLRDVQPDVADGAPTAP